MSPDDTESASTACAWVKPPRLRSSAMAAAGKMDAVAALPALSALLPPSAASVLDDRLGAFSPPDNALHS
jgi:hypothetical protein